MHLLKYLCVRLYEHIGVKTRNDLIHIYSILSQSDGIFML